MINRNRIIIKWVAIFLLSACLSFVCLAGFTNVSTGLTDSDISTFRYLGFKKPSTNLTFEQEISLIKSTQQKIFEYAPLLKDDQGIPTNENREPFDLLIRLKHGLCYDRSRTLDKVYTYLGFESRHVYILYKKESSSFLRALATYGQPSHAVTEVKTSRGWMVVDSNAPWIALSIKGEPISSTTLSHGYSNFENPLGYFLEPFWAIPGLYSRKGHLYEPRILFPEFNWADFVGWIFKN